MHTANQARDLHLLTTLLVADIDPAWRAIEEALAGWPTSVPMAGPETVQETECGHPDCNRSRPCPTHGNNTGITHDRALTDKTMITRELADIVIRLRKITDRTHYWATTRQTTTTVARRLTEVDTGLWCKNCTEHGHQNVKNNGDYCTFCCEFKLNFPKYKQYPPKPILDIHAYRRLNVSDVKRIMEQPRKPKTPTPTKTERKQAATERQRARLKTPS